MRLLIVLGLLALKATSIKAQELRPYTPDSTLSQISVYQWTGDNGLVSNNITSSLQSSNGFIWITTYTGIMRFDGENIDIYDRNNINFLSTDAFYKIYQSSSGILYFCSRTDGIVKLEDNKFTLLVPSTSILPKSIRCLYIESDTSIYVGSSDNGLYKITGQEVKKIDNEWLDNMSIYDIKKDENGDIWIATDGNGVIKFDGKNFERLSEDNGLKSNKIIALELLENMLLIGTFDGLNVYKNGQITTIEKFGDLQINAFLNDKLGRTWIGTEKGLGRIDWKKNKLEFIDENDDFPFIRINNLHLDHEGSIWASTGRDGLLQIKKTAIINYTPKKGLSTDKVNIAVEIEKNHFMIGSDLGSIDILVKDQVRPFSILTDLKKAGIRDINKDNDGNYWVASYRGLLKIFDGKEKLYTTDDGFPAVDLRRVLIDNNGTMWLGSRSGGIWQFDGDKILKQYNLGNGLQSLFIMAIEQDKNGDIYVGTHSGGMTIISKDGNVTTHNITEDDLGIIIFNIEIKSPQKAWIATSKGIYSFNNGKFKSIKFKDPPKGISFYDWITDKNGDSWITTNTGVLKVRKNELERWQNNEIDELEFQSFDHKTWMKNKEITGATRVTLSSDGRIFIPTAGGIAIIYPENIEVNSVIPKTFITKLEVQDSVYFEDNAIINPGNTRYLFNFTALSYIAPEKMKFKYQLVGFDEEMRDVKDGRQMEYTNLDPGDYTFKIVSCNNDGVWNEEGASLNITVLPFYYQTWWFYTLVVIIILMIIYSLYRWRVVAIERKNSELSKVNSELDKFVYSASHDLRAPLSSILGIISLIRIDKEKNLEDYLGKVETSIKKLDGFIKDIIDFSRNARLELDFTNVDFGVLIDEVINDIKYLGDKIELDCNVIINGTDFRTDRKRLTIILRNLISNSYRYADRNKELSFLNINVDINPKKAIIVIEDNGVGIEKKYLRKIFDMFYRANEKTDGSGLGLYIVKETLERIGGRIKVISNYGEGTKFTIEIPNGTNVLN